VPYADARAGTPPREPVPPSVHGKMGTLLFIFLFKRSIVITCNVLCVFLAVRVAWWLADQRVHGVRPVSQGQGESAGQRLQPGGRGRRLHQPQHLPQACPVHRGRSQAPWGRVRSHHRAPGYRPPDEVGTRQAARPVLDGQQRDRVVLCSQAERDSSKEHELLLRHPHSTSAAELDADDGGFSGKYSFIRRSLVLHMCLTLRV
jgi:hypothetical protein